MTQSKTLTEGQVKKLHQLENMALMLDKSCQAGEIDDADIEKAQTILNKASEVLIADRVIIGPRLYIVYENQALLHWIDGNGDDARDFAKIARDIKGGGDLFTETANDLIGADEDEIKTKSVMPDAKLVGLNGWLAWFVVGLVVSILYNFFSAITGFADKSIYTSEWSSTLLAAYPNLPTFINFENVAILLIAIFGIFLLISIIKLKKKAIKIAIGYSVAIITFELLDIFIAYSMFANNKVVVDSVFSDGKIARAIIFSFIWLLYFIFSKRVKLTLTKE
jgi:hypothetical protein